MAQLLIHWQIELPNNILIIVIYVYNHFVEGNNFDNLIFSEVKNLSTWTLNVMTGH
jgi:hypothetical protein